MITFSDVQSSDILNSLSPQQPYSFSFFGDAVDERGNTTIEFSHTHSKVHVHINYGFRKFELSANGSAWRINQFDNFIRQHPAQRILIDATTLNSIEMALLIRGYMDTQQSIIFDVLYAEPGAYAPKKDDSDLSNSHAFELSTSLLEESYTVPGFKHLLKSNKEAHVLIVAGFEKERLGALLNGIESHHVTDCTLIFGIPPFQPSMEIHSLMQNAPLLENKVIKTIDFAGANNPISTLRVIDRIKQSLAENEVLELAPIGPKPSTIACALYAAHDRSVGLRYDFPKPARNRTTGIGRSCLYTVKFQSATLK